MSSVSVSSGQLGCIVAWRLVVETPLEVAAREVAMGREQDKPSECGLLKVGHTQGRSWGTRHQCW
jgi:hypothetical protein